MFYQKLLVFCGMKIVHVSTGTACHHDLPATYNEALGFMFILMMYKCNMHAVKITVINTMLVKKAIYNVGIEIVCVCLCVHVCVCVLIYV